MLQQHVRGQARQRVRVVSLTSPLYVFLCLPGHETEGGWKDERKEEEEEKAGRVGLVMKRRKEKEKRELLGAALSS